MSVNLADIIDDGFRVAIEAAPTGIVVSAECKGEQQLVYVNPAFEQMSGYENAEILGRNCRFLQGRDSNPDAVAAIRSAIEDLRRITIRLLNYRKDRSTFWNELTISPIIDSNRTPLGFVGIQKDVTAEVVAQRDLREKIDVLNSTQRSLEEARRDLQKQAHYDPLTGLASRALFFDRLNQALARSYRTGDSLAVIMVDLDGFKSVNDLHGHEVGDRALHAVADRMRGQVRKSDTLARMGGDEFLLLMDTDVTEPGVAEVCDRLVATCENPFEIDHVSVELGMSLGVAVFPTHGKDAASLVRHADIEMYAAKVDVARGTVSSSDKGGDPRYGVNRHVSVSNI